MAADTKKVLVVDDEHALARALELKLTAEGMDVTVAHDGEAALELIRGGDFELVLLDLVMPKLDGFGVLEAMQKDKLEIPVIVLSNLGQEEDADRAKALGAKDFFVKSNMPVVEIVRFIKEEV